MIRCCCAAALHLLLRLQAENVLLKTNPSSPTGFDCKLGKLLWQVYAISLWRTCPCCFSSSAAAVHGASLQLPLGW